MNPTKLIIIIFISLVTLMSIFFPGDTHWFSVLFFFTSGLLVGLWWKDLTTQLKDEFKRWHN